jgi:hypothetical protein
MYRQWTLSLFEKCCRGLQYWRKAVDPRFLEFEILGNAPVMPRPGEDVAISIGVDMSKRATDGATAHATNGSGLAHTGRLVLLRAPYPY